jgi:hypothetical protein
VPRSSKDFWSTGIWGSFGVEKRGAANRESGVEPVPTLMTDGWTVEAKQLKNRRVAETKRALGWPWPSGPISSNGVQELLLVLQI